MAATEPEVIKVKPLNELPLILSAQAAPPPVFWIALQTPDVATLNVSALPLALPIWLSLIFNAVVTAPVLEIPKNPPLTVAVEVLVMFRIMLLLIFTVAATPLLAIAVTPPEVEVVAAIESPIIEFPVIFITPGADRLVIPIIEFDVETLPPMTQF